MALLGQDNVAINIVTKATGKGAKEAKSDLTGLQKGSGLAGKALGALGKVAVAGAAAGVAALGTAVVASTKKAIDFQSTMTNIATLISGDSTQAINELKDGILDMTSVVPKSADELGAAAYDVVSAGIKGTSNQLKVLESSGKLAVAGLGDTAGAVDIMTSAINAFNLPAEDSGKISDILFKTVKNGKTTVDQMSQAFGATAPIVASAGFALEDFSAATAALTTAGTPAAQAQNQIRAAVVALTKPTADMSKLFDKMGVKGLPEMIDKGMTMGDIFQELSSAAGGNAEVLTKAFGSVEAYNAAVGVGSTLNEAYSSTLADMSEGANSVDEAFEKQRATVANQIELIKNRLMNVMIRLGDKILPLLTEGLNRLTAFWEAHGETISLIVSDALQRMRESLQFFLTNIWPFFEEALRNIVTQLMHFWDANKNWLIPTLEFLHKTMLVVGVVAIGALVKGIEWLLIAFNWVVDFIRDSLIPWFMAIYNEVAPVMQQIFEIISIYWHFITDLFHNQIEIIKAIWIAGWEYVKNFFVTTWQILSNTLMIYWELIKSGFVNAWNIFKGLVSAALSLLKGDWRGAWETIKNTFSGVWENMLGTVSRIWGRIQNIIKAGVNGVIGSVNAMIRGINSIDFKAPDWVPGIGGKGWSPSIPEIPRLAKGTPLVTRSGMAVLHEGESVVPAEVNEFNPEAKKGMGQTVNVYGLNLPNVTNYKQFKEEMARDNSTNRVTGGLTA